MMTKVDASKPVQGNLFKVMLRDIVCMSHKLVLLRNAIDWDSLEKAIAPAYCANNGRPSIPVRMMIGLTFLKYMFGLSDQEVLDNWCENPYWQYFCGEEFFMHEPPTDQTVMSRWRKRAGEIGATKMLAETLKSAVRNKVAKVADFKRVNVDTTVQEKNVRFPSDAGALERAREKIVSEGKKLGIRFDRNYVRKGKSLLREYSSHIKAKQYKRADEVVSELKQQLQDVIGDVESFQADQASPEQQKRFEKLNDLVVLSKRLIAQDRTTPGKDKVYSVHEPQVECIAKGKVHKQYEFGVKAGFVTASRTNWILGAMALPGNQYDGKTLATMLEQAEKVSGVKPQHAYCDLGYRGNNYKGDCDVQIVNRFRKNKSRSVMRWWKRRSAIEPVIGHLKSDHCMERNMLAGAEGDKFNAVLAAVGFNLVKLMRGLKCLLFCLRMETDGFAMLLAELLLSVPFLGGGGRQLHPAAVPSQIWVLHDRLARIIAISS